MANILYENGFPIKAIVNGKLVDVQEVRHGRWIVEHGVLAGDGIYGDMGKCSVCGVRLRDYEWNYCPNCGASMMGDDDKHGGTGGHGGEIKTIYKFDENYCTEENCETFQRDLSCERCTK